VVKQRAVINKFSIYYGI